MEGTYLSKWQGRQTSGGANPSYAINCDLRRLKAERPEIAFLWIKATQGTSYVDPLYEAHRRLAEEAGYPYGLFHYFTNDDDPLAQARHFWNVAGRSTQGLTLRHSGDFEDPRNQTRPDLGDRIYAFLGESDALFGAKGIPYTRATWWNPYVRKNARAADPRFNGYRWWLAHYNTGITRPWLPVDAADWAVWQIGLRPAGSTPGLPASNTRELLNPSLMLADISYPVQAPPPPPESPPAPVFVPHVWSFVTISTMTPEQEQGVSQLYDNLTLMFEDFKRLGRVRHYDPLFDDQA